jgi:hypothetical protein
VEAALNWSARALWSCVHRPLWQRRPGGPQAILVDIIVTLDSLGQLDWHPTRVIRSECAAVERFAWRGEAKRQLSWEE